MNGPDIVKPLMESSPGPFGSLPSSAVMSVFFFNYYFEKKRTFIFLSSDFFIFLFFKKQDIRRNLKRFGSNIIFFNGLRDPWSGGGWAFHSLLRPGLKLLFFLTFFFFCQSAEEYIKEPNCNYSKRRLANFKEII